MPNPEQQVSGPNVDDELEEMTRRLHCTLFCDPQLLYAAAAKAP